jgi:hypothetical protein
VIVVAGLASELQLDILKLLQQQFGVSLFLGGAANRRRLHLVDHGFIAGSGFDAQVARQQKIAAIALRHFHNIPAMTEVLDIFFQNDFHISISKNSKNSFEQCSSDAAQTAAERCCEPA